jgi:predicted transglutaminase-like cysteine proteinase
MWRSRRARRLKALSAIVLGLAWLVRPGSAWAGAFEAPVYSIHAVEMASAAPFEMPPDAPHVQSSEPFGSALSSLIKGGLQGKWSAVTKKLPHEHGILLRCRADAATCPLAARRFLRIVDRALAREGLARIAEVNRAINLEIRPVDDLTQYGVVDLWATPLMAFASDAGDCEDYAIAKYVALHEAGIAEDDLRLVVVHDFAVNEYHVVAAVRYDGHWLILDNRTSDIRQDSDVTELDPLLVIDRDGVKRMTPWASRPRDVFVSVSPAAVALQFSAAWPITVPLL